MSHDHPATGLLAVTPSNSANLVKDSRALWIGVTGDVAIMATDGTIAILANVPVGILPVQCRRVFATGTTATGIVALL